MITTLNRPAILTEKLITADGEIYSITTTQPEIIGILIKRGGKITHAQGHVEKGPCISYAENDNGFFQTIIFFKNSHVIQEDLDVDGYNDERR